MQSGLGALHKLITSRVRNSLVRPFSPAVRPPTKWAAWLAWHGAETHDCRPCVPRTCVCMYMHIYAGDRRPRMQVRSKRTQKEPLKAKDSIRCCASSFVGSSQWEQSILARRGKRSVK